MPSLGIKIGFQMTPIHWSSVSKIAPGPEAWMKRIISIDKSLMFNKEKIVNFSLYIPKMCTEHLSS